jgi:SNF2 family DNA or RNA helicase
VGLNLTAADYVFLLDPWWNPAAEDQAVARAHRIGQERPVTALRFIARDSIEEKIRQLQERKKLLGKALFATGAETPELSREDLEGLLA